MLILKKKSWKISEHARVNLLYTGDSNMSTLAYIEDQDEMLHNA